MTRDSGTSSDLIPFLKAFSLVPLSFCMPVVVTLVCLPHEALLVVTLVRNVTFRSMRGKVVSGS